MQKRTKLAQVSTRCGKKLGFKLQRVSNLARVQVKQRIEILDRSFFITV